MPLYDFFLRFSCYLSGILGPWSQSNNWKRHLCVFVGPAVVCPNINLSETHLVDERCKSVVQLLDLLFLLGADRLDGGIDLHI